nr:hypothetical protein Q903MT_gene3356 [Picea sitchensis]
MCPPGPLHLHDHCCNPGVPKSTPSLHASIQATQCHLGLNALLQDAQPLLLQGKSSA